MQELKPNTPAKAVATAAITLKTKPQVEEDFFIKFYLLSYTLS